MVKHGLACTATQQKGPGSLGGGPMIRMKSKGTEKNHFLCSGPGDGDAWMSRANIEAATDQLEGQEVAF